jgi:hypothetical protein
MTKVFMLLAELPLDPKGSPSSNSYRIRKPRARYHWPPFIDPAASEKSVNNGEDRASFPCGKEGSPGNGGKDAELYNLH